MAKKSSRRCSEKERAERRCADRELLRRVAEELLSSEGWARWVRVRSMFRAYSAGNRMLLAHQRSLAGGVGGIVCPGPRGIVRELVPNVPKSADTTRGYPV